ncbi:tumor necrosis factor ligand superfamily member 10 isoform X1 [Phascolarctos cinereus]|uniref:Tumor necrosis factor ligand superfamily member 10 n=1 Tax=Phascolarctos cinereus TaxID=38626 RepID=A0A6P5JPA7_PHACI|nr:tumor necrosis factor ligand superfamily member 10 isoform X1 [Phascolarctos cinereus]
MSLKTIISRDGPSPSQACGLLFLFPLMVQALFFAATYFYFTNELKQLAQLQDASSQSSLVCLTKEYLGARMGDPSGDAEQVDLPCLQFKWQLQQLIRKELLTIYKDYSASQGKPFPLPSLSKVNPFPPAPRAPSFLDISQSSTPLTLPNPLCISNGDNHSFTTKSQMGSLKKKHLGNLQALPKYKRQDNPSGAREKFHQSAVQRVAAHLTGNRQMSSTFSRSSLLGRASGWKINYWESSRKGHSFLHNVDVADGELIIPQTGYYYIYSQTYFRFQELEGSSASALSEKRNKQPKQLVQYIYKVTSYPEPILLLKSVKTSCWSKDSEYGLYSIYQGGVFELRENERIFVSVSNEKLIDMDKEASFFGAFLIG